MFYPDDVGSAGSYGNCLTGTKSLGAKIYWTRPENALLCPFNRTITICLPKKNLI